jgi:methyltransferase family protein
MIMADVLAADHGSTGQLAELTKPADDRRTTAKPAMRAQLLLPVWGYRYIRQFFQFGLPTLLAPGNLPALAQKLDCEFIILTSTEDVEYICRHPVYRRLSEVCPTSIRAIDHLIMGSNHSTTITLAYTEAIRAAGPAALDTFFFFLVSDYIMANGSLDHAIDYMRKGASGVLVGNFQVALEDALPWLEDKSVSGGALVLPPRELVRWGLSNLHPTTIANTVNFGLSHNSHTNRLFWRVDGDTLLGRFYLMHMLCIRPEVTDFVIGSSCDYSFVPELCPSGNVVVICDSDEYAVVEMQPRDHEASFLRPGPLNATKLGRSLSEWTTARHRANAAYSVIFHAGDIPPTVADTIARADKFVANVRRAMTGNPMPHRRHPYWRGAIAAFNEATGRRLSRDEWRLVLGLPAMNSRFEEWMLDFARFVMFGQPPSVRLWHPRWPDYHLVAAKLSKVLGDRDGRILMVSDSPTIFTVSLGDDGEQVFRLRNTLFLDSPPNVFDALAGRFDLCLLELSEGEMARGDELVDRLAPLMKTDGEIMIVIYNRRAVDGAGFVESIGFHARRLLRPAAMPTNINFVPASRLRWHVQQMIGRIGALTYRNPISALPVALVGGAALIPLSTLANLAAAFTTTKTSTTHPRGIASSVIMVLRVNAQNAKDAYKYSASRILRARERRRRAGSADDDRAVLSAGPAAVISDDGIGTREPQYNRCVDLKTQNGLTPLGLMTNQVWFDDPRRLGFLLARYKFVAKMLSGRRDVGEVGCGDAFGTRIVLQEVEKVTVYDFDPLFIEDVRERQTPRWPIESRVHDIVTGVLPYRHDAIYSLDVIEHITRLDEHAYLANLRGSLADDGVLIIGSPSLESQSYASPPSKAGHVNCKSGPELKALLEQYFSIVFMFSMNDEVVHTGFYPMAHYLIAIACHKK